ncbi:MAG TPA: DMT family transporter [Verrucomicrobiae bacterium]|jgi:drug/metabolite transporter (DMT)-like permease|nr:DMT family transporter [Verrucomicrobiae bacterium]
MREQGNLHFAAVRMLAATTVFWSLSFPLVKAIGILQSRLVPGSNSWFHASLTGVVRFSCAGVILLLVSLRTVSKITRLEIWQGVGLGFFAAGGILLQMDGLSHTSASVSAFITQGFCVIVPIFIAFRDHRLPSIRLAFALAMMMAGIGILSNFDVHTLHLGRGELETLIAAVFFAGQILWLDRPLFARNNVNHFSIAMFFTMALFSLPILLISWQTPRDVWVCYSNPGVIAISASITVFCTVIAFVIMNKWQPLVPPAEAAIIYGAEPVFASLLALFLPGIVSKLTGIDYPNETITGQLLVGGILVLLANLILQLRTAARH